MSFYYWNNCQNQWQNDIYTCARINNLDGTHIKHITLNVLFDENNNKPNKPNVIYSQERYENILAKLFLEMADIITLNEVTTTFLKMVEKCNWIRKNYFISETSTLANNTIESFGNLIITKIYPSELKIFKISNLQRPIVVGIFHIKSNNKIIKFSVSAGHLTSLSINYNKRKLQLIELAENLSRLDVDLNIIQGDMNFHSEDENECLQLIKYYDAWQELYDIKHHPGYTFDAEANHMIQEIWSGFECRQMRLDRIFMSSNDVFKIKDMKIIFNKSIYETNENYKQIGWINAIVSQFCDLFQTNVFRQKEEYLFNSDHFGLTITFEI